jgi:ketosteroid isomerase-like protein
MGNVSTGMSHDVDKLTAEQVKAEVQRFWNVFMSKDAEALMGFYTAESTVFSSVTARPEPGRLAAARRQREYFHKASTIRVTVGMIDVVLLGDSAAVASYTFQFHATKVASSFSGAATEEEIKNGRATHVFQRDGEGKVLIVHEHLSAVEKH